MTNINKELSRLQYQERMNVAYTKILSVLLAAVVFTMICLGVVAFTEGNNSSPNIQQSDVSREAGENPAFSATIKTGHKKSPKLEPRALSGELYNA